MELEGDIVTPEFVEGINSVRIDTIEDFKTAALDIGLEKCPSINRESCESKEDNLNKIEQLINKQYKNEDDNDDVNKNNTECI